MIAKSMPNSPRRSAYRRGSVAVARSKVLRVGQTQEPESTVQ